MSSARVRVIGSRLSTTIKRYSIDKSPEHKRQSDRVFTVSGIRNKLHTLTPRAMYLKWALSRLILLFSVNFLLKLLLSAFNHGQNALL